MLIKDQDRRIFSNKHVHTSMYQARFQSYFRLQLKKIKWDCCTGFGQVQWKLCLTRSLGPGHFVCYIRYFVISVANKQYKT